MTNPVKLEVESDSRLSFIKESLEGIASTVGVNTKSPDFGDVLNRLTEYTAGQLGVSTIETKPRRAKLTWEKVDDIRERYGNGQQGVTMTELAEKHGVSYSTVSRVVTNKMWIKK